MNALKQSQCQLPDWLRRRVAGAPLNKFLGRRTSSGQDSTKSIPFWRLFLSSRGDDAAHALTTLRYRTDTLRAPRAASLHPQFARALWSVLSLSFPELSKAYGKGGPMQSCILFPPFILYLRFYPSPSPPPPAPPPPILTHIPPLPPLPSRVAPRAQRLV